MGFSEVIYPLSLTGGMQPTRFKEKIYPQLEGDSARLLIIFGMLDEFPSLKKAVHAWTEPT